MTETYLYLAPLRGITDVLFRTVFASHFGGFDLAVAPFINPQRNGSTKKSLLADVRPEDNLRLPIIPQLLNNDAAEFLELARRLQDQGHTRLNWNLGCPAPMVANKRRGSGLLAYPEQIVSLLELVLPKLSATLSIKMRLGFRDPAESLALLPLLEAFPLEEIIIHPRLGKQLYRGITDLEGFAACLSVTGHRVVYNGDITSLTMLRQLQERFPAIDRWMLGRGVLRNPFLADEIRGEAPDDPGQRIAKIRTFHDDLYRGYQERLSGPGHLLGKMKQLWLYLVDSFPGREKELKKITKAHSQEQYLTAVQKMFGEPETEWITASTPGRPHRRAVRQR